MEYILLVIGFVLLIEGANIFVDGASGVAKLLKIPTLVIGLTIVAIGTSLPELMVSVIAGLKGNSDIAISNVVGSNLFNLLIVCGICAMIRPLPIGERTLKNEFPFSIVVTIIAMFLAGDYLLHGKHAINVISRLDGGILLVLFVLFFVQTIRYALGHQAEYAEEEDEKKEYTAKDTIKYIVFILGGMIAIKYGGDIVVDEASAIARNFGISQNIIGLTVVAFGTSLPELVTSIIAVKKGETDMAIGNVIGSNIFNVLLILGVASVVRPISVDISSIYNMILLNVVSIIVWVCAFAQKKVSRLVGCGMASVYIVYMVYVCMH